MAATGIKEVRHPHDAVMDLILAYPWATLLELSKLSSYSPSWLSQMIRSDCFQAEYHRRRGQVEAQVMAPIQDRLQALSHLACDKMEDVLTKSIDSEEIVDAFDKVLHRSGYAPKAQGPVPTALQQQNNYFLVQKDELASLREKIIGGGAAPALLPPEPDE